MYSSDVAISLYSFIAPLPFSFLLIILPKLVFQNIFFDLHYIIWWILLSDFFVINLALKIILKGKAYQIGIRAALLGTIFCSGLCIVLFLPTSCKLFGWYMCIMAFFHYSEFLTIGLTNPATLSIDSFILNHSNEYTIAAVTSWIEFFVELYFFPGMKEYWIISCIGFALCITGEVLRKVAMFTAANNFNHIVQHVHKEGHTLVTNGVYSLCRHPSYMGWFYWAIGTQIVLLNPFCIFTYILASWKFFNERIFIEEMNLLNFFGVDYMRYQKTVGTGLPFIKGYQ